MIKALYRKWRPMTFDDVCGQSHITETLKTQIIKDRISHAYIFTGSRGTGKTTCAKILSRAVNCTEPLNGNPCNKCRSCLGILDGSVMDVAEIDAASNNGVDSVRALRDEAIYTPSTVRMRVYIIDEVHMLSNQAFNALLKILEEPPEHLLFILATTELHKVPLTITSRCQRFSFKRLEAVNIESRLEYVSGIEKTDIDPDALKLLARLSDGSMRDALSMLDQCAAMSDRITEASVRDTLGLAGNVRSMELVRAIAGRDSGESLNKLTELYMDGRDLTSLLSELSMIMRDLLILKTAPKSGIALLNSVSGLAGLEEIAAEFTAERLISGVRIIGETLGGMQRGGRMAAELCIIRLCGIPETDRKNERAYSEGTSEKTDAPKSAKLDKAEKTENNTVRREAEISESVAEKKSAPKKKAASAEKSAADGESGHDTPHSSASWTEIIARVRDKISIPEYMSLSNPELASANYKNGTLTVVLKDDFTKNIINKPHVTEEIKSAAGDVYGVSVNIAFALDGENNADDSGEKDKLDDLILASKQFNNIIIK